MKDDLDSKFNELVAQLGDVASSEYAFSIDDLNSAVGILTQTAMFISDFIGMLIKDNTTQLPSEIINLIPPLMALCETVSIELHDVTCDECGECNCEDELEIDDEETF